jgi:hypothetical protein
MTVQEKERLAKVEANQDNMSDNINEIKQDIKEMKVMMQNVTNNYITKKAAQFIVTIIIAIFTAAIYLWDALLKTSK